MIGVQVCLGSLLLLAGGWWAVGEVDGLCHEVVIDGGIQMEESNCHEFCLSFADHGWQCVPIEDSDCYRCQSGWEIQDTTTRSDTGSHSGSDISSGYEEPRARRMPRSIDYHETTTTTTTTEYDSSTGFPTWAAVLLSITVIIILISFVLFRCCFIRRRLEARNAALGSAWGTGQPLVTYVQSPLPSHQFQLPPSNTLQHLDTEKEKDQPLATPGQPPLPSHQFQLPPSKSFKGANYPRQ